MSPRNSKKKSISPSRQRFEDNNPVVSGRISRELYDEFAMIRFSSGTSIADIFKIGLDKAKPDLEAAWQVGAEFGYETGYYNAQQEFEVTYRCHRCRKRHLSIDTEDQREAAAKMMYQEGWHDPDCRRR